MKKVIKIVSIIYLFSVFCGLNHTKAEEQFTDCDLIMWDIYEWNHSFKTVDKVWITNDYPYSNFLTKAEQKAIIDKESLDRAILNLKKYCFKNANDEQRKWRNNLYKKDQRNIERESNTLDSPYLFDHIFDILMRKYAWFTWEVYNLEVDWSGAEWRKIMTEIATSTWGSNPQDTINKYNSFRYTNSKYDINSKIEDVFITNHNNVWAFIAWNWGNDGKRIAESLKNYKKRTLTDKYNNACWLSIYLYSLLLNWSSDAQRIIKNIEKCNTIAKSQIDKETAYTNLVIQRSSDLFQKNYVDAYTEYLNDRKDKLQKKRKDTADKFKFVSKAVPQIVRNCRK